DSKLSIFGKGGDGMCGVLGFLKGFFSFVISFLFINRCLVCNVSLYEPDGLPPVSVPEGWPEETITFLQNRFQFKTIGGISLPAGVLCADCWLKLCPLLDYPIAVIDDVPVIAPFSTNETLLKVIRYLKFSGGKSAAKPLVWWMAKSLKSYLCHYSDSMWARMLVVPVPLHKSRKNQRGYNQASLLASYVSTELRCRFTADLLIRVRNTKSQSSLDASDRGENVLDAFDVIDINKFNVKDIVLVDDLVTTGKTAGECIRILKREGAPNIILLSAGVSLRGVNRLSGSLKKDLVSD
ncbi:ComF family protein, partial [bacterium]|nr:ComF family protein [bacterium]